MWSVDPLDGGILEYSYPSTKESHAKKSIEKISLKIKNIIQITVRDMVFKTEWSLSPITAENTHFYLYGFFVNNWFAISIMLPIDFSLWLIDIKSDLLLFESLLATKVNFFPKNKWEENILKPLYEAYYSKKLEFEQIKVSA